MPYSTEAELIELLRGNESRYRQISGDPAATAEVPTPATPNFDRSYLEAVDEMESAVRGRYNLPLSEPLPAALASSFAWLQLWYLAKGMDRKPEFVETNAKIAREYLAKLGTGRASLIDTAPPAGAPIGGEISVSRSGDVFDLDDPMAEINRRLPPL